jgi:hypothetical protein
VTAMLHTPTSSGTANPAAEFTSIASPIRTGASLRSARSTGGTSSSETSSVTSTSSPSMSWRRALTLSSRWLSGTNS